MLAIFFLTNCKTPPPSIQGLSSLIFPCLSSFVVRPSRMVTSPLYDVLDHTNHTFSESSSSNNIKNYIPMCQTHKYKSTYTQTYKYSIRQRARKTQHVVYFWQEDCSRIWKIIFPSVKRTNTKYTNTQIQHVTKLTVSGYMAYTAVGYLLHWQIS